MSLAFSMHNFSVWNILTIIAYLIALQLFSWGWLQYPWLGVWNIRENNFSGPSGDLTSQATQNRGRVNPLCWSIAGLAGHSCGGQFTLSRARDRQNNHPSHGPCAFFPRILIPYAVVKATRWFYWVCPFLSPDLCQTWLSFTTDLKCHRSTITC